MATTSEEVGMPGPSKPLKGGKDILLAPKATEEATNLETPKSRIEETPFTLMIVETARSLDLESFLLLQKLQEHVDSDFRGHEGDSYAAEELAQYIKQQEFRASESVLRVLVMLARYSQRWKVHAFADRIVRSVDWKGFEKVQKVMVEAGSTEELATEYVRVWELLVWQRPFTGKADATTADLRLLTTLMLPPSKAWLQQASLQALGAQLGRGLHATLAEVPEVLAALEGLLAESSPETLRHVLETLGKCGERAATPNFIQGLEAVLTESTDPDIQTAALEAARRLGEKAWTPKVLERLGDLLLLSRKDSVLTAALEVVKTVGNRALTSTGVLEGLEAVMVRGLSAKNSPQAGLAQAAADFICNMWEAGVVPLEIVENSVDSLRQLGGTGARALGRLMDALGRTQDATSVANVLAILLTQIASTREGAAAVRGKACFAVQKLSESKELAPGVVADLVELTRSFEKPMRDQIVSCRDREAKEMSAARKLLGEVIAHWSEADEEQSGSGDGILQSTGAGGSLALPVAEERTKPAVDLLPTVRQSAKTVVTPAEEVARLSRKILPGGQAQWLVFPLLAVCQAYEDSTAGGTEEAGECLAVLNEEEATFDDRMQAMVSLGQQALEQDEAAEVFEGLREMLATSAAGDEASASIPVAAALVQVAVKHGLMEQLSTVDNLVLAWGKGGMVDAREEETDSGTNQVLDENAEDTAAQPASAKRYPYTVRFLTADHMAQAIGVGVETAEALLAHKPSEACIRELPRVTPADFWASATSWEAAGFELIIALRGAKGTPSSDGAGVAETGRLAVPVQTLEITLAGALRFFFGGWNRTDADQRRAPAGSPDGRNGSDRGDPAGGGDAGRGSGGGSGGDPPGGQNGIGGQGLVISNKLEVTVRFNDSEHPVETTPRGDRRGDNDVQITRISTRVALELSQEAANGIGMVRAELLAESNPGNYRNGEKECGYVQTGVDVDLGPTDDRTTALLQNDYNCHLISGKKVTFTATDTAENTVEGNIGFQKVVSLLGKCGVRVGQARGVNRDEDVVAGFEVGDSTAGERVGSQSRLVVVHGTKRYARGALIGGGLDERRLGGAGGSYRARMSGSWRFADDDATMPASFTIPAVPPSPNPAVAAPHPGPPQPLPPTPLPPTGAASSAAQAPLPAPAFHNFSIGVTQSLAGEAVRDKCFTRVPCVPRKWSMLLPGPIDHQATMKFKIPKDIRPFVGRHRPDLLYQDGAAGISVLQFRSIA